MRAFDRLPYELQDWLRDEALATWSCQDVEQAWKLMGRDTARAIAYYKREDRK